MKSVSRYSAGNGFIMEVAVHPPVIVKLWHMDQTHQNVEANDGVLMSMMRADKANGRAVKSEMEQKQTQSHCCVCQHEKVLDQTHVQAAVCKKHDELTFT